MKMLNSLGIFHPFSHSGTGARNAPQKLCWILVILILIPFSIAQVPDPGHSAAEVGPGTFCEGNYVFPRNLSILDRVGIGKTNPQYALDVNGTAYIGNPSVGGSVLILPGWVKISVNGYGLYADSINTLTVRNSFVNGTVDFKTGGDNIRMVIGKSGNVSIDNTTLFVDADNNKVGIGTSNPTHTLNVVGDLNVTGISYLSNVIINADSLTLNNLIPRDNEIIKVSGDFNVSGTIYAHNYSANSDITFINSSGGIIAVMKEIGGLILGEPGQNTSVPLTVSGDLRINNSVLFVNSSTGKIGIGTLNPTQELHVVGNANITETLSVKNISTEFVCLSGICQSSWPIGGAQWSNSSTQIFLTSGYPNYVNISNSLFVNGTSRRIGIGTSNPTQALDVIGNTNISGNLTVSGNITVGTGTTTISTSGVYTTGAFYGSGSGLTGTASSLTAGNANSASNLACTNCVSSSEVDFNYANSTSKGGPASDVSCANCVTLGTETSGSYDSTADTIADDGVISSGEVNFNYANSTSKGGPASDVACSACISASEISGIGACSNICTDAGAGQWTTSGSNLYSAVSGNVGIGTTNPLSKLSVGGDGSANSAIYASIAGSGKYAIYGSGDYGIFGQGGVYGISGTGFYGVYGTSTSNYGGYFTSSSGTGVYGSGGNIGVQGEGYYGVRGIATGGGYAGYFSGGDVYATGKVSAAGTPMTRAYRSGAMNCGTSDRQVSMDAIEFDVPGSRWSNGVYNVPATGKYFIVWQVTTTASGDGQWFYCNVKKGSTNLFGYGQRFSNVWGQSCSTSSLYSLNAGDLLNFTCATETTERAVQTGSGSTFVSIHWVGP